MNNKLLKQGDVIRLEKGMRVFAPIPKKFLTRENNSLSEELDSVGITIGDVFSKKIIIPQDVVKSILNHFGFKVDDGNIEKVEIPLSMDTNLFEGEYTVTHIDEEGHQVYCEKNDGSGIKVNFYQIGCFTVMIKPDKIKPINSDV